MTIEVASIKIPETQLITVESPIVELFSLLNSAGYKPLIVGGAVRDAILGIQPKDIDIEVYKISYNDLSNFLGKYGRVDLVGKTFGVIKFKPNNSNLHYDFSVPRKENKIGIDHTSFEIMFDPDMTIEEGATRRDFTFNALAYDPIENKIYDYFGGLDDLKNGVIKHTSDAFKEDALRILRCMQFQARFNFSVHASTIIEIRKMLETQDFENLSKERIFEEWSKWATKGIRHDLIFQFMRDTTLIDKYPELKALKETPQDPIWHPEGDVEIHTTLCLQEMDRIIMREGITGEEKMILLMSILLHDIGKPATTEHMKKDGRMAITSHGHEALGGEMAKGVLSKLGFHDGLINPIANIISDHLAGVNISMIPERRGMLKAVKKLSRRLNPATIKQLTYVMEADSNGRGRDAHVEATGSSEILSIAEEINAQDKPYQYILMGRHLIDAGLEPSVRFGDILRKSQEAQENGEFDNLDGGKVWLEKYLQQTEVEK